MPVEGVRRLNLKGKEVYIYCSHEMGVVTFCIIYPGMKQDYIDLKPSNMKTSCFIDNLNTFILNVGKSGHKFYNQIVDYRRKQRNERIQSKR
jgi:hypothetical protein